MMLKRLTNLVLLSAAAVLLAPHTPAAAAEAVVEQQQRSPAQEIVNKDDKQEQENPNNQRDLGNRHRYRHHVAIQEAFAAHQGRYAEDDDGYHSGGYLQVHDTGSYYDYHVHEVNYLPEGVRPRPFTNCIPESYHENNRYHGKHNHKHGPGHHKGHHGHKHHGHGHGHKHHAHQHGHKATGGYHSKSKTAKYLHNYDGHHHHDHDHEDDDYVAGAAGTGSYLTGYSKGKGKGGYGYGESKSKGGKSSKGYYYRRDLSHGRVRYGRGGHHHGRARGRHGHGHNGQRGGVVRIRNRQGNTNVKTMFGTVAMSEDPSLIQAEDFFEDDDGIEIEPQLPKTKKYHHFHHHHHDGEMHLPICPNTTPVRKTFGPVPTIPPRDTPTMAPGNETAPTVASPGDDGPPSPAGFIRVESSLGYGFFEGTELREAMQDEVDRMLMRTSEWYLMQLQPTFPTLEMFDAVYVNQVFDPADTTYPVTIDFDAHATFTPGTEPTFEELFMAMQALDYEMYITAAVWTEGQMDGLFEMTERTTYNARIEMSGR